MQDQIDQRTKNARYRTAMALQQRIAFELADQRVGRELKLLVDEPFAARSESDAPDVDTRVILATPASIGEFVTRKITRALARIQAGLQDKLFLGNLDAKRDWGYAPDYTDAMWRMLQADEPDDYVIATGEMHSVREFLDVAGGHLGINWQDVVEIDPRYYRPAEVDALCGDATKAREKLGWAPTVTFAELVRIMVDADVKLLEDHLAGRGVRLS